MTQDRYFLVPIFECSKELAVPVQASEPTREQACREWWRFIRNGVILEAVQVETEAGERVCLYSLYDFVRDFFGIKTITLGYMPTVRLILRLAM
jgi:hypothetical protein